MAEPERGLPGEHRRSHRRPGRTGLDPEPLAGAGYDIAGARARGRQDKQQLAGVVREPGDLRGEPRRQPLGNRQRGRQLTGTGQQLRSQRGQVLQQGQRVSSAFGDKPGAHVRRRRGRRRRE